LQEASLGAIFFARPKFLGALMRGDDGAFGIEAVLGVEVSNGFFLTGRGERVILRVRR